MRGWLAGILATILCTPAFAEPLDYWLDMAPARYEQLHEAVTFTVEQVGRGYRYTGWLTLMDPDTGEVLGRYHYVSGGAARGSAPFGQYAVGDYRSDGAVGPRWELRELGRDADVWDPKLKDYRTWLEIHRDLGGATEGCIGIEGNWTEFVATMRLLVDRLSRVTFTIGNVLGDEALMGARVASWSAHHDFAVDQHSVVRARRHHFGRHYPDRAVGHKTVLAYTAKGRAARLGRISHSRAHLSAHDHSRRGAPALSGRATTASRTHAQIRSYRGRLISAKGAKLNRMAALAH